MQFTMWALGALDNTDRIVDQDGLTLTILDGYPVSLGHTLVIPRRHVASMIYVTPDGWTAIRIALDKAKAKIDTEHARDGYIVSVNVGEHGLR